LSLLSGGLREFSNPTLNCSHHARLGSGERFNSDTVFADEIASLVSLSDPNNLFGYKFLLFSCRNLALALLEGGPELTI